MSNSLSISFPTVQSRTVQKVQAQRLRWGHEADCKELTGKVDVVLSADCLYFDEGRKPLVDTIWNLLTLAGVAVILAPRRGTTFEQFVQQCEKKGFLTEQLLVYDTRVWELHEQLLLRQQQHQNNQNQQQQQETRQVYDQPLYQPELHYPNMIVLRKQAALLCAE